jgi:hypothetical protein
MVEGLLGCQRLNNSVGVGSCSSCSQHKIKSSGGGPSTNKQSAYFSFKFKGFFSSIPHEESLKRGQRGTPHKKNR